MTYALLTHGRIRKIIEVDGGSLGAFFLGALWYCFKGMWSKGLGYLVITLVLSWTLVVPFILWIKMICCFHSDYYEYLLERGYVEDSDAEIPTNYVAYTFKLLLIFLMSAFFSYTIGLFILGLMNQ